ncbi:hypothetical protein ACUN24_21400 [Pedobacter sp. WC2501]|uniref:hypothetical protein n=1 Tax=Pedobacter sp. WC2501 TaxID=3461400 RepID=UPI004046111F
MKEKKAFKLHPFLNTIKDLPSIYVSKSISDDREHWFDKKKFSILNQIAKGDGAASEIQEVYFPQAGALSNQISEFLKSGNVDGLRIYFGSFGKKIDEIEAADKKNCGRFNFIFAPTSNKHDIGTYYKKNGAVIDELLQANAERWIANYQQVNGKRYQLKSTLSIEDQEAKCYETKHVWFDLNKTTELRDMIIEQLNKDSLAGLKIKLVSYTNEDFVDGFLGAKIPQKYKQRLTVIFVFTDEEGVEIYKDDKEEEYLLIRKFATLYRNGESFFVGDDTWTELFSPPYDNQKWNAVLLALKDKRYAELINRINNLYTMDTGDPTPPPSTDNKAALDVSDQ